MQMYQRCFGRKIHICITHKQLKIRYIITYRSSFMLCMRCQVFLSVKTCLKGQDALVRMFISPKVHQSEGSSVRRTTEPKVFVSPEIQQNRYKCIADIVCLFQNTPKYFCIKSNLSGNFCFRDLFRCKIISINLTGF